MMEEILLDVEIKDEPVEEFDSSQEYSNGDTSVSENGVNVLNSAVQRAAATHSFDYHAAFKSYLIRNSDDNTFRCSVCDFITCEESKFIDHIHIVHKQNHTSQYSQNSYGEINVINKSTVTDIIKPFQCLQCGNRFLIKRYLRKHVRAVHERPYKCSQCEYSSGKRYSLNNHIMVVHENQKPVPVISHDCRNSEKSDLGSHVENNDKLKLCYIEGHEELKPFECSSQDNYSWNEVGLLKDVTLNERVKPFQCPQCGNSFHLKRYLRKHIRAVHDKPYRCTKCEYRCGKRYSLNNHIIVVHEKEKAYQCSLQDCSLDNKSNLDSCMEVNEQEKPVSSEGSSSLSDDINAVKGVKPFHCAQCGNSFRMKRYLLKHIRTVHVKPHQCALCEYKCGEKYSLNNHFVAYHDPQKSLHSLRDYRYDGKRDLDSHCEINKALEQLQHSLDSDGSEEVEVLNDLAHCAAIKPFQCPQCNSSFHIRQYLMKHIRAVHGKPYKCSHCEYRCGKKSRLNSHIMSVHEKQRPFLCLQCNNNFSSERALHYHVKTVHENLKEFHCSHCTYSGNTRSLLLVHIKAVHLKLKPFKCPECKFTCAQSSSLHMHINSVHKKLRPFKCSQCDYASSVRAFLNTHVRAVHEKQKPFKCSECEHCYTQKSALTTHVRAVHRKLKPFHCSDCEYTCSSKSFLNIHVQAVHEKLKPFHCPQCDFCCSQKGSLSAHAKSIHGSTRFF